MRLAVLLQVASLVWAQTPTGIRTFVHTYGPFSLRPDKLPQSLTVMDIVFPEDMWLVGYRTEIVDDAGQRLSRELQCHTFLGSSMPLHHHNEEVVGLFSDGYTESIELPPGFGLFFKGGSR